MTRTHIERARSRLNERLLVDEATVVRIDDPDDFTIDPGSLKAVPAVTTVATGVACSLGAATAREQERYGNHAAASLQALRVAHGADIATGDRVTFTAARTSAELVGVSVKVLSVESSTASVMTRCVVERVQDIPPGSVA